MDESEIRYFVVRAYDYDGYESEDSNEVMYSGSETPGDRLYREKDAYGSPDGSTDDHDDSGCFIAAAN